MIKVDPQIPIKNIKIVSPVAVLTKPVSAVGIALTSRIMPMRNRGPNLSTNGPRRKRMRIVPVTADMEDHHICSFEKPNVDWTSERSGERENLKCK
jgi:hypothetical protein